MKILCRIATIVAIVMGFIAILVTLILPEPVSITLDRTSYELRLGERTKISAQVHPEELRYSLVSWKTNNENIATVDKSGYVEAVGIGEVVISATTRNGKKATCNINVIPYPVSRVDLVYNYDYDTIGIGETASFSATAYPDKATYKTILWSSSDPSVVSVDQSGNIVGLSAGQADIIATADGVSSSYNIKVKDEIKAQLIAINYSDLRLKIGDTRTLVAEVFPGNTANKTITWSSSDNEIVTVDAKGKITALKLGNAKITATASNGVANSIDVEVVVKAESIKIHGYEHLTNVNNRYTLTSSYLQLTCVIGPDNTTYKDVEWSISNFMGAETARISENGYLTVLRYGHITVTARIDGCVDTIEFYVPMGYN